MYLCFSEITQGTFCTPGEQTCKIISIHKIFKEHLTHLKAFHILGCKNLARNISRCFSWLTFPCVCVVSCSVVSDSLRPQGLQPPRLFYPWNSPGKNTGVGNHFLPQGIFPNPWFEARSALQEDSLPSEPHQGRPFPYFNTYRVVQGF